MSVPSESRGGTDIPASHSAIELAIYHKSSLEAHQPDSPCERTTHRATQIKKEEYIPPSRISFQNTPVCPSSSQRNLSTTVFPSHTTPYALYNCSASRLEGFPYRDSLWEAQLKDHPYGRRSYELGAQKVNTSDKRIADSSRSLFNEGDGSLDSSDADLDLTVELASPNTSYGTPGNPPHPADSCTAQADFTSITMANSSVFLPGPTLRTFSPSTPDLQPTLPLDLPPDDSGPRTTTPLTAPVTPDPGRAHVHPRQFSPDNCYADVVQAHCGSSIPQGYSYNPTPPLGLSQSRPRHVLTPARIPSETLEVPPTPALTHADEDDDFQLAKGHYTPDTLYNREELSEHLFDPFARQQATLQSRRRSSIGSDPLRIVVEQQTSEPSELDRPLVRDVALLTSPSASSHLNSPLSLAAALSSPHSSTAPTSPSICSPHELPIAQRIGGDAKPEKLHTDPSKIWRVGTSGGGWQALSDFFSSRVTPHLSSRASSPHETRTSLSASALPSLGLIGSESRLSGGWSSANAIESLVEPIGDLQDDVEQYWIHKYRRSSSNHPQVNAIGDPRRPSIPAIRDDRDSVKISQSPPSSRLLNTPSLEVYPEDGPSSTSWYPRHGTYSDISGKRGRTTSVPVPSISSPEEVQAETERSLRRSSWQHHQRIYSTRSLFPGTRNHHFRQISAPSVHRQRMGCNVGGLPTISTTKRSSFLGTSFGSRRLRCPFDLHMPRARPTSKFSDSESSMILLDSHPVSGLKAPDFIQRIRLGNQRSSSFKPILMPAQLHPEPTSAVKGRRSTETAPVAVSKPKGLLCSLSDSIVRALQTDTTGPRLRRLLTATSARRSPNHSWFLATILERANPAAVTFWLGFFCGPWFFVLGGWYLSSQRGELGRAQSQPRLPARSRNLSNGQEGPNIPSKLSWVLANRIAACVTGPIVIGAFVWSIVLVFTSLNH
ncbi:hypothetical protein CROQUDRAFT_39880 [Cronartium quercuum f. sp. fusiforme G11]|uniref:Uncharacterized protein n=1 Tax=Cronartium quercuum f. sp. fusiforme G11 TaxID=708437 RepID=A0A9P6TG37_9BASI|nr:hypothetical protein CROQUDRAFT_39880 [Cronartium quercuum f. sp. fusiforme G11]